MNIIEPWFRRIVRAPDEAGGAAGDAGAASAAASSPAGDAAKPEGAAGAPSGDDPLGWLQGVELDEQARKGLIDTKTVTPAALFKRMTAAERAIRGDVLEAPPADPEKRAEWLKSDKVAKALGIPADADGYDLTTPDLPEAVAPYLNFSPEREKRIAEIALKAGVPADAWKALRGEYYALMASEAEQDMAAAVADEQRMATSLRTEWGDAYDDSMRLAVETARRFGIDERGADLLRRGGVIGSTGLARALHELGRLTAEDGALLGGGGGGGRQSEGDAKAALAAFDKEHGAALMGEDGPERLKLVARRKELMAAAGMTPAR